MAWTSPSVVRMDDMSTSQPRRLGGGNTPAIGRGGGGDDARGGKGHTGHGGGCDCRALEENYFV